MSAMRILTLPFHLGRERVGMGNGPDRFVAAGVAARARDRGAAVELRETTYGDGFDHEAGTTFAVLRAHANSVRQAVDDGAFPLTLGGNCNTAVATAAALGDQDRLGVIWFDAHGDANTPETTASGFLDGMSLAVLAGWCWQPLATSIPGFHALPESNVLLAATRAIDDDEQRLLDASEVTVVDARDMRTSEGLHEQFLPALDALVSRVDRLYLHIDLDAIDLAGGRANQFSVAGGPTLDALTSCIDHVADRGHLAAASLTSYDPGYDHDGAALHAGLRLLDHLCSAVAASSPR